MRRVVAALPALLWGCTVKLEVIGPVDGGGGGPDGGGDASVAPDGGPPATCGTLAGPCCGTDTDECGAGLACVDGRCSCFADLTTGNDHTCVLRADGTVWCWGRNDFAQAGVADLTQEVLAPAMISALAGVVDLAAGGQHSCALRSNGEVVCWGNNEAGQLGAAASMAESDPVTVAGLPDTVVELALGSRHSCARTSDGKVWCWGCQIYNDWTGCATFDASPAEVSGLTQITRTWAHHKHTCARTLDGSAYCWGRNDYGQLGDGTRVDKPTPTQVTLVPGIIGMGGGRYHACALREDGQLWCWANNEDGQLGRGTMTDYEGTAQAVPGLPTIRQVVAGGWYTCALANEGEVLCWGDGSDGQLGYGGVANMLMPNPVTGLFDVLALSGGSFHVCAHEPDAILCWGENASGSVGNGTGVDVVLPLRIMTCAP
jgi:alpha-tubulin suppressor-like RCC1 family protein